MLRISMKYTIIFLLIATISSCNLKSNSDTIADTDVEGMFIILSDVTDQSINYLKDDIRAKTFRTEAYNLYPSKIHQYDSLTKDYLNYLTKIEEQFLENNVNPFFNNSGFSDAGKEYLSKTKLYENEIIKLVDKSHLKNKVHLKAGAYNQVAMNGREIEHLDYYFYDLPHIGIVTYLKIRKQSLLELQKEFLNELIIDNCN